MGVATPDLDPNVVKRQIGKEVHLVNAAKRFKKAKSGVCLVHQVLPRLSQTWRRLKSAHLCSQVELPTGTRTTKKTKTQAA